MKPVVLPPALEAAFQRFMAAYPKRRPNPTAPARLKFAEAVRVGEDPEALIAAAQRFAATVKAEGIAPAFIPQTRRWLHQREFEDFLSDAPATAPEAEPSPDHPLAWMRADMTAAAFSSWIATLTVDEVGEGFVALSARTAFQRDHVMSEHGRRLTARYGAVRWRIEGAAR